MFPPSKNRIFTFTQCLNMNIKNDKWSTHIHTHTHTKTHIRSHTHTYDIYVIYLYNIYNIYKTNPRGN